MQEEKDEVKIEPVEDSEASEEFGDPESLEGRRVARMREELSACRREKQEYMDGWQRAKADYVNALKRFGKEADAAELQGKMRAIEALLPAFDALERAKEHEEIPVGFLAIAKQLESAFASLGLEELGKVGEKFNPALHEALEQVAAESLEMDDTVAVVLEKGWRVNGTVIRPARVRVAHYQH